VKVALLPSWGRWKRLTIILFKSISLLSRGGNAKEDGESIEESCGERFLLKKRLPAITA